VIASTKHQFHNLAKPLRAQCAKKLPTGSNPKAPKVSKPKAQSKSTNNLASDIQTLPEFARATWLSHFLPTLYSCLGCSLDPFIIGSDIIKLVQAIVNAAYPGSRYLVIANDKLVTMVCRHAKTSMHSYFS
jgi:hypothetical protein